MIPQSEYFMKFLLILATLAGHAGMSFGQSGSGYALDFDGVNDYVEITDHSSLNPRISMTVEAWIYPTSFATNVWENSILCKHNWSAGNKGYVLRCGDGGRVSFNICSRSSGAWVEAQSSASVLDVNKWYHIAGVFDGDSVKVYVNGILRGFTLYSGLIDVSTGGNARIGQLSTGTGRNFNGMIDEVRLWDTAVDIRTMRQWMCRKLNTSHKYASRLQGHWRLDEGKGGSIADSSSNNNSGKISGAYWRGSGASIGDQSVYTYGGKELALTASTGDKIHAYNFRGSPSNVHLYLVEGGGQANLSPSIGGELDSTHYYGVYLDETSGVSVDVSIHYKGNSQYYSRACDLDLLRRYPGDSMYWEDAASKLILNGDSIFTQRHNVSEFGVVFYPMDSNKVIRTATGKPWYCKGDSVRLIASGNSTFKYQWFYNGTALKGDTFHSIYASKTGKYRVELSRKGTNCSVRSTELNISEKTPPKVSFSGLKPVCESVDTIVLRGGSPSGGIYRGITVRDSLFFPSAVRRGTYQITYSYTDTALCTATASQTQLVWALPSINPTGTVWTCDNVDSFELKHHTPFGGTYTGLGIAQNYFLPDSVNGILGMYGYVYTYTDTNKCSNTYLDSLELRKSTIAILNPIPNSCLGSGSLSLLGLPKGGTFSGNGVSGSTFSPDNAGVGSHTITYRYVNGVGCPSFNSKVANVYKGTAVGWNFSQSECINGDSVRLPQGTPTGGTFSGRGVRNGYFIPGLAGAGNHTLRYQYSDSNKCVNFASGDMTVFDTTVLSFQTTAAVCPGADVVDLLAVSPSGGNYRGDAVQNNQFDPKRAKPGKNAIHYEFTNSNNCLSMYHFTVELLDPDPVQVQLPESACAGDDPVRITVTPSGGTLSGTGIIGQFFVPASAGTGVHRIVYSYPDPGGCTVRDTAEITVAEVPAVSLGKVESICQDHNVFSLEGGSPLGGKYYANGQFKTEFDVREWSPGRQQIRYVFSNEWNCSDSAEIDFWVNPLPSKPIIVLRDSLLQSSASQGNQWYSDAGMIEGATEQNFRPSGNGRYWVSVQSDSGCVSVSDTFLYDLIGISRQSTTTFSVYPNPAHSLIHIVSQNGVAYTIFDVQGRSYKMGYAAPGFYRLSVGDMPRGIYFLQLIENKQCTYLKMVLE